jgi:hypothetical protein
VRLQGDLGGHGTWKLSGVLAESGTTTWRMAAEFAMEPDDGHLLEVGTGYGSRFVRPGMAGDSSSERSVGAVFVQERWEISDSVTASLGGRYAYVGFLEDASHFNPFVSVELRPDRKVRLHATFSARTLAPGGDALTVSSTSAPLGWAELDPNLRPSRTSRLEMGVDRTVDGWTVSGLTFYELVSDQLVNDFTGPETNRSLRISNSGDAGIAGVGISVGRRFGRLFTGTVTYSMGRAWTRDEGAVIDAPRNEGDFHDLATRVETGFDSSDTRIVAYYRLNAVVPEIGQGQTQTSRRFDVQVSQGLPFIGALTRADWDVLVAVRNLFYEVGEGSTLDELSVINPPKRVLGGIAVRF